MFNPYFRGSKLNSMLKFLRSMSVCFALLFIGYSSLTAQPNSKLDRVDPAFWWVDMVNPELQIMAYGEDIATTRPEFDYPGVILDRIVTLENPNYLFLYVQIQDAQPGTFTINFKRGKKTVASYDYELKPRNNDPNIAQGLDASDVMYLLMPDRYTNGNPDNDEIEGMAEGLDRSKPNGRHGGDIVGIQSRIDYMKDLGITTIWPNPVLENDMPRESYHGYAITDWYQIDRRLGTNEEYRDFVKAAHDKGLKVMMDQVFNHMGTNSFMIKDLPSTDWIHQWPEFTRSNFTGITLTDPYASDYDVKKMVEGWFDVTMADLNQEHPQLADYLIQASIFWIEYAGIDGIRMDTYPYNDKEMMADWVKAVKAEYPDFYLVAETWLPSVHDEAYWQGDDENFDGYNAYIGSISDFPLFYAIMDAFRPNGNINKVYETLARDFLYAEDPINNKIFASNHDVNRLFTALEEQPDRVKLALAFTLTTRGIPQLYYGSELMFDGVHEHPHGIARKDMPGGWDGDTANVFTVDGRTELQQEAYEFTSHLLNWRKDAAAIHTGKLKHYLPQDQVYVYSRYTEDHKVIVIINNSNEERTIKKSRYAELIGDVDEAYEVIQDKEVTLEEEIKLSPSTAYILDVK